MAKFTATLVARHSDKLASVVAEGTDNGAQAIQWTNKGKPNQEWNLEATSAGYYVVRAIHSGKAPSVLGEGLQDGAEAVQRDYVNKLNQEANDKRQSREHVRNMRAFAKLESGVDSIELAEVAVPQIDDDELLVRVKAVGVGIHDSYFLPGDAKYPFPIGIEAAGVVEQVGSRVSGHRPGDRIAFVSSMQPKGGTWAEYAAVKAGSLIVPVPTGLDFVEAAAVPVAGTEPIVSFGTCWVAVGDRVPAGACWGYGEKRSQSDVRGEGFRPPVAGGGHVTGSGGRGAGGGP
ncbi:RICIN domain-containing protein [Streptosporangium sp. NBC_01755]|uniref:alcohol dehydrogenase catalytic domain-containing protein n=1 Tax=Streptosporangium sp. NBC_01755 TaxID=2975949 RepID=UPI002DDB0585|nr:RICIN domain-containing protein [Streptosporangium sp. NBC_01755]WSC97176.1 RICIN domain-containing protein [Streptosporangium sp. NBC_01755]